ncbi:MAG: hypothetical protein P4L81_03220 [Candidatus Pacebacteria bacterium]|nr:hypothetical protein [Candidatus Paceibacterota bacterium]
MRKIVFSLITTVALMFSSAAFAGPPCNIHVGGLCGSDYDGWMQTWHRSNPGHTISPVSPGGYGILPNGQIYYPNQQQGVIVGGGTPVPAGIGMAYRIIGMFGHQQFAPQRTPWTGHRDLSTGIFYCDSGPCPRNGARGN